LEETLKLRLAGGPDAAARARASLLALNSALERFRDVVKLLLTELVTNSVRHGGGGPGEPIEIELSSSPKGVRVQVTDSGAGFDGRPARRPDPEGEGGYGLFLVEQLADRWGVVSGPPARVWFEIDRTQGGP
jgi:anti-sigma regulatory factor (Ser/Thr protein kinase)